MIGKKKNPQPTLFIPGSMEDYIPKDHILKKVDRVLDLSWLREEVADLYCEDNGRPCIDPEAAVRLMLAGFFHGIVHDRKLMREAQVNIAIRWFAGYTLEEALPNHSTLTRIRQRWGAERFRRIFEKTVAACAAAGLVNGETVHIDATLIRADVSWESLSSAWADAAMSENAEEEKESALPKPGRPESRNKKPKKRSTTDPDATLTTNKKGFHMEPCYKQHTAVDDEAGIIVDIHVTTGETSEGELLMETIERIETTTGKPIERVTADAGYAHSRNYSSCEERGIDAVIPPQRSSNTKKSMPSSRFKYDGKNQRVRCPAGRYMTSSGKHEKGLYFHMSARVCSKCALKTACLPASSKSRSILIVNGYEALLRARRRRACWDEETRETYNRHRWLVEGAHGEAKTQHGLRRAARRGMENVSIQAYLTAVAMNLKKLAAFLSRISRLTAPFTRRKPAVFATFSFFSFRRLTPVC